MNGRELGPNVIRGSSRFCADGNAFLLRRPAVTGLGEGGCEGLQKPSIRWRDFVVDLVGRGIKGV
jgi:hypothetical protein